jgi:hypothetical protein
MSHSTGQRAPTGRRFILRARGAASRVAVGVIEAYRLLLSSWLPPSCRFEPCCSRYAQEAIQRFGLVKGAGLAARRIGRCHPFHPGGLDPVPDRRAEGR